ncbi:MAG: hypothetical protein PHW63_11660, partial [Alphaproteobacteria bacterium]|nr:hypothetical protein [Alphaproteobacteria bacterium]
MVRYADAAPSLMQKSVAGWDGIGHAIGITSGLTYEYVKTQDKLAASGEITQTTLRNMGMTTEDLTRALINGSPQYDNFVNRLARTGPEGAAAAAELDRTRLTIESIEYAAANATSLDKYASAMDVLGDKTSSASDKLNAFKTALDIATGVDLSQLEMDANNIEQIGKTVEALGQVSTATGEYTGVLDINNESHRNLIEVMDSQRDTMGNTLLAMEQQGASHEEMTAKVAASKQSFIDQAIAMGQSKTAAQTLADQIFGIPSQTAASVSTPGLAESIEKFKQLKWHMGETPDKKGIYISDNAAEAISNIEGLEGVVKRDKNGRVYINTDDVPRAANEILSLNGKNTSSTHTVTTNYINGYTEISTGKGRMQGPGIYARDAPRADGAINKWIFANGGTRLPIEAKIQPSVGTQGLIQWAEASTHGEAFIPLNPAKKARSSAIWLETGKKLGLIKSNADGSVPSGAAAAIAVRNLDVEILAAIKEGFAKTLSALTSLRGGSIAAAGAGPSTGAPGARTSGVINEIAGAAELAAAPETVVRAGSAISDTINNVVNPSMRSLDQQLITSKTGVIDPTFQGISGGMTNLGMTVPTVTSSMINPAIAGMGANLMNVGQGIINPALAGVQNAMTNTGNVFGLVTQGAINPLWNDTANNIMGGVTGTIEPAFNGIMGGLGAVSNSFGQGASNIAAQWSRVREATASPVRFAITSVFNDGLIGMWNSVSEMLGTTKMNPYPVRFATGTSNIGSVLPGYTPGRDPYTFIEPRSGMSIGLSGGEAIMRPEVTKVLGSDRVDNLNAAARIGGVSAVKRSLGNFAGGGVVESITGLVNKYFPGMSITSTYRNSADHHGSGLAVDFSNGTDTTPQMQAAARFFHKHYAPGLLELIHYPLAGWQNIDNGVPFDFGPGTNAQHRNHVHVAAARPLPEPG